MQVMGLLWILVYWNIGGLLNPWFTIFITVNQALAAGVSQVLFSMAVIELAKPGQEAITYELIVSVANAALTVTVVLATQLLTPFKSVSCAEGGADDDGVCKSGQVNTFSIHTYHETDGPARFTKYSIVCMVIGLCALLFFTPFLPRTKAECAEWKQHGDDGKFWLSRRNTGLISSTIAFVMVGYVMIAAVAILNPATSCLPEFGGSGC
jgi:hypothetical protein